MGMRSASFLSQHLQVERAISLKQHSTPLLLQLKEMEIRQEQNHPQKYDRSHPGAGKAGRGDQAIDSMQGVSRFAKGQTGAHDHRA